MNDTSSTLNAALERVASLREEDPGPAASAAARALAIDAVMTPMAPDPALRTAALVFPLVAEGVLTPDRVAREYGPGTRRLVDQLQQLAGFGLPTNWTPDKPLPPNQAETLRKMLLAIVKDVRLVLVRLADQLCRLRDAKKADDSVRQRVATETQEIFAPLANRLGVWHLKWELEDLAFRYLDRDTYHGIAKSLKQRRTEREGRIREVIDTLEKELSAAGIEATIQGRPKHIYSIYKKMQRKRVGLEHIFDVSAVRVLVKDVTQCYVVLGIVHGRWPLIPEEFDDYIARPKGNYYRSLHTAVMGPGNEPLEVQIRTREMHEHAELGVAAHWRYKEGGGADPTFEKKINWLRQLLDPGDEEETDDDFVARVRSEVFEDRVYAFTPRGDVADLPARATPLDFAYQVHTDVGHHCRGARVNGRMVSLNHRLASGDTVEIITAEAARPSRDWLIPQRGYLASPRSRAKVRNYFRRLDKDQNLQQGRALLEKELARLSVDVAVEKVAESFNYPSVDQLYLALGAGDITLAAITGAIERDHAPRPEKGLLGARRRPSKAGGAGGITVSGVGDLLTQFARCCRPVPPEHIVGYITQGRGVSIHRDDCSNLLRLQDANPERVITVTWGSDEANRYPADVRIEAYDRQGLLRDISGVLANDKVDIIATSSRSDRGSNTATIDLTLEIASLEQLSVTLHHLGALPNVFSVKRRR